MLKKSGCAIQTGFVVSPCLQAADEKMIISEIYSTHFGETVFKDNLVVTFILKCYIVVKKALSEFIGSLGP